MSEEQDHFAVVYRVNLAGASIFEGSEEEVYTWLARIEQRSMWWIWSRKINDYESSEEFMKRVEHKYQPKPQLTEEDVRRIVDRRVREVLETVGKEAEDRASGLAAYETAELMRPAFAAFYTLMENITDRLAENDNEKGVGG